MLTRAKLCSKLLAYGAARWSCSRFLSQESYLSTTVLRRERNYFFRYFSNDCKDSGSKVSEGKDCKEDKPIKTHPTTTPAEDPNLKLKECKPVNIDPCRPPRVGFKNSRIPSIRECSEPDMMSEKPDPKCPWDEHDKEDRKKNRTILWLGLLFSAVTLGAVWYVLNMDKTAKEVVKEEGKENKISPNLQGHSKDVPYLLIGGGTASFSAFRAIKSADPTAKVLVIAKEPLYPYMRPPLSKEIWFNEDKEAMEKLIFKQWNGSERSLFYEPDDFYTECKDLMGSENGGVAVARGWWINRLDIVEKKATLDDGAEIHYEKCLLATGATPKLLPVFEVALSDPKIEARVKTYRNVNDLQELNQCFEEGRTIAIIGGGFLGSELACALARRDKGKSRKIYQIFREGGNMGRILPEYLSYWTTDKVKAEGVQVLPRTEIVGVKSEGAGLTLMLQNGKNMSVDYAVVAVGVEPNTDLAEESDLEVDPDLGGYLVNTELQARSDLYIAGDCSCFYDPRLGRRRIEHHDHAVVTGRLAGENMTGARKPYLHQSMFWSDLGPDVGYEAIGVVDSSLPTVAVFAKATDKDNPKAVVTATDEGIRSNTEEVPRECEKYLTEEQKAQLSESRQDSSIANKAEGEDFGKGVIFYLRDDIVVGIVLWNVFNRMSIARQVLKDRKKYDDLNEVAKLFNIHEE